MKSISALGLPVLVASAALAAVASGQTTPAPSPAPAVTAKPVASRAVSAQARKEGKALFARVVDALGGKEKAGRVRDVQTRGQLTAKTPQGDMTMEIQTAMIFPDHLSQQIDAPFGRLAMVATPAGAFLVGPNGVQDLPGTMRDEMLKQVQRVPLLLVRRVDDPKLELAAAGTEKIGEIEARILDVVYGSLDVRWFIDSKTGHIVRSVHTAIGPDGKEAKVISDYSDFKPIDGFPVPHRLEVTTNGEKDQTLTLEECKFNVGVEATLFEKPAPPAPTRTPSGS